MTETLDRPAASDLAGLSPAEIRAELLARASALVPVLRERALATEKAGHILEETIEDLRAAGLLRAPTPPKWGGYEGIDYDVTCEIGAELGRGDAAVGWCYSNWMSHNWMAGMLAPSGQAEYFSQGPDILTGTASPATFTDLVIGDEGFTITGKWVYSSGSHYSQYFFLGLMDLLCGAMVPRSAVTVLDTWRPAGLKGTSTNSITAENAFAPPTNIWTPLDSGGPQGPSAWREHERASYRLTMWMFSYSIVAPVVGAARGALEVFRSKFAGPPKGGPPVNGGRTGDSQALQILLAESAAEVDAADLLWRTDIRDSLAQAREGIPFDLEHRARIRRNQAYAAKLAARAVTRMFEATGGSALDENEPLQRFFRDVHAALHHITVPWEFTMADYGSVAFEQPFTFEFQRDGIDPGLIVRPPMPPMPPPSARPPVPDVDTPTTGPTITLPESVRTLIDGSLVGGHPLVVAYRNDEGFDKPSYRGSTHVHGDSQLALWVRNPEGALPRHVAADPAVTVVYRDPVHEVFYRMSGRARLETDPAICAKVYADSPFQEQMQDPQRAGVAMIIDVTRIAGVGTDGPILLES